MGPKIKTQKNPQSFQPNPKKSLDQTLTPKESHAEFPTLKDFQKGLNDITPKKKVLETECLCLFMFIIRVDFIFSSSGSHSNNTADTHEHLLFQQ